MPGVIHCAAERRPDAFKEVGRISFHEPMSSRTVFIKNCFAGWRGGRSQGASTHQYDLTGFCDQHQYSSTKTCLDTSLKSAGKTMLPLCTFPQVPWLSGRYTYFLTQKVPWTQIISSTGRTLLTNREARQTRCKNMVSRNLLVRRPF